MESHGDLTLMYADLAKSLTCPICEDKLKSFEILSCDHTYCLECVKKLVAIKDKGPVDPRRKLYDIYLHFSQDTVHVHKVKDIIHRNGWTMMTANDCRLGVPKMTSIEDALKTCSHVVHIITKEDCEKQDPYNTMMIGMAFQSTVGGSLNGRVITIRCCEERRLPLSLQSLENAFIDDRSLEDKLKRSIDVSIRKNKEGSLVGSSSIKCCPCQKKTSIPSTGLKAEHPVQIFVRDRLGGKVYAFNVSLSDTADAFKRQVEMKTAIRRPGAQRLIYRGRQLQGSTALKEYGIKGLAIIHLTLSLKGGNMIH